MYHYIIQANLQVLLRFGTQKHLTSPATVIFLHMMMKNQHDRQESGKCNEVEFGAQCLSRNDQNGGLHQTALLYERDLQNTAILLLFCKGMVQNLRRCQGQLQKVTSLPIICKISESFIARTFFCAKHFEKSPQEGGGKLSLTEIRVYEPGWDAIKCIPETTIFLII